MRAWMIAMAGLVAAGCAAEKSGASMPEATRVAPAAPGGQPVNEGDPCAGGKVVGENATSPGAQATGSAAPASGAVDTEAIRAALHGREKDIKACASDFAGRRGGIDAKVEVRFTIATTGEVGDVAVSGDDRQLADCIAVVFRGLHFPPSGTAQQLVYPITLKAAQP